MLECKPTEFNADILKAAVGEKLCQLTGHVGRFCREGMGFSENETDFGPKQGSFWPRPEGSFRPEIENESFEGEKISEMIFADWAETTDSHLDSNLLMTLKKVQTLNQWNAIINQILFRRSFDTKEELVMSIKSYINSGSFSSKSQYFLLIEIATYFPHRIRDITKISFENENSYAEFERKSQRSSHC